MSGKFITLEGGEGSGKSTLIEGLAEALRERGRPVLVTREPGGTILAEHVRELALHPPQGKTWSPLALALLMNAAREDHLTRQIRPALRQGHWVLCDRFSDSTRAYQSINGVSMAILKHIEQAVLGDTRPDLTFILDAAPDQLLSRRQARGDQDVFEQADMRFHTHVRQAFLDIAKEEAHRCTVINALQPLESVRADALSIIQRRYM